MAPRVNLSFSFVSRESKHFFNLIYCHGELIVSIVVLAIAVFRRNDYILSSTFHC